MKTDIFKNTDYTQVWDKSLKVIVAADVRRFYSITGEVYFHSSIKINRI